MRVIHILDHSIPLSTEYALRTIAMLAEQRALGWETFHLTGPHQGPVSATEECVDGWTFFRTPPLGGLLEGVPGLGDVELMGEIAYRIEQLARRVRPHILHAHSPVLNALPALRVGRRLGLPVVYEVRPLRENTGHEGVVRLQRRFTRALETWVMKRADAVTTVCAAMRDEIVTRGIPAAKITVIPDAPDHAAAAIAASAAASRIDASCRWQASAALYRDVYAGVTRA